MTALCLAAAAAAAQLSPCAAGATWRPIATEADRQRLRGWRPAWLQAQDEMRAKGKATTAGDALFDLDHALDRPSPPPGAYRCRFVKLGGAAGLVERPWGDCRLDAEGFAKLDGPQRPAGQFYPDSPGRAVFLGTLQFGDEARPLRYGRDDGRDMAGYVERIGDARWRIVLPHPQFESTLDLLELTPAQ